MLDLKIAALPNSNHLRRDGAERFGSLPLTPLLMCVRASRLRFLFSSHRFVCLLPISLLISCFTCLVFPLYLPDPSSYTSFAHYLPLLTSFLPFSSPCAFISLLRLSHLFSKGSEVNQVGDHVFSVCLCVQRRVHQQPIRTAAGNWEHWFISIISLR